MKKILLMLVVAICSVATSSALEPKYKGYGEFYTGYTIPSENYYYGPGANVGLSTSHGVTLIPGLFVGAGMDLNLSYYTESSGNYHEETDYAGMLAFFAEGRYNILRTKKVSPFAGLRIGGGINGIENETAGSFYFSPAFGCTINLTQKFGLDASIGYALWTGKKVTDYYSHSYDDHHPGNVNCVTFRVGVHF